MKNNLTYLLFFLVSLFSACTEQESGKRLQKATSVPPEIAVASSQIGEYVVEVFEDSKGILWFGTISKGVLRYDPKSEKGNDKSCTYLNKENGLCGNTVVSIAEDKLGNLWFGTHEGLTKYDGKIVANFTEKEGLCHNRISKILIDSQDNFWIGTWNGICLFDGKTFTDFLLPKPAIELHEYQSTMNWITEIIEDSQGSIWFGRDGYGACKYTPAPQKTTTKEAPISISNFTHFTKKDGLPSNNVQVIEEDGKGNIWLGTRVIEKDHPDENKRNGAGGLCRYAQSATAIDAKKIIQFPNINGLHKNDIYTIYNGPKGNTWIGATGTGLYKFAQDSFTLIKTTNRMDLTNRMGIQGMLEDSHGTSWLGFSGGLFQLRDSSIINITLDDLCRTD